MEVTTINQIISVGGVLASTWLGLQVKNASEKENFSKKAISKSIVVDVLSPILDALSPYNRYTPDDQRKLLMELVHTQRALIPPPVLEHIESVLEDENNDQYKKKLLLVSESFFNFYKREIGYPYNPKKINSNFVPNKELKEKRRAIAWYIFGSLWISSAAYTFLGFMYLCKLSDIDAISISWAQLIPVMVLFFGIPLMMFSSKS